MKTREYKDYVRDIIESISDIEVFIKNMTFTDFVKDKKTINAVVRSIEVIGEASKKIPDTMRKKNPSIPWKKMAGMRDKLIHEYFGIDFDVLWKTVKEDIPSLHSLVQDMLKSLEE